MADVELITVGNALDLEGFPISAASRVGDLVHTCGVISLDPDTGEVVEGDIVVQGRRVLDNLKLILEAAGRSLEKVAMVQVFIADPADLPRFNEVYVEYFAAHHPPRFAVGTPLAWPSLRVEVHAVAAR